MSDATARRALPVHRLRRAAPGARSSGHRTSASCSRRLEDAPPRLGLLPHARLLPPPPADHHRLRQRLRRLGGASTCAIRCWPSGWPSSIPSRFGDAGGSAREAGLGHPRPPAPAARACRGSSSASRSTSSSRTSSRCRWGPASARWRSSGAGLAEVDASAIYFHMVRRARAWAGARVTSPSGCGPRSTCRSWPSASSGSTPSMTSLERVRGPRALAGRRGARGRQGRRGESAKRDHDRRLPAGGARPGAVDMILRLAERRARPAASCISAAAASAAAPPRSCARLVPLLAEPRHRRRPGRSPAATPASTRPSARAAGRAGRHRARADRRGARSLRRDEPHQRQEAPARRRPGARARRRSQPRLVAQRRDQGRWAWRCHFDCSRARSVAPGRSCGPTSNQFDAGDLLAAAVHAPAEHPRYVVAPSIDPLSDKNRDMHRARGGRHPARPRHPSAIGRCCVQVGAVHAQPRIRSAWSTPTGWSRSTTTCGSCWPAPRRRRAESRRDRSPSCGEAARPRSATSSCSSCRPTPHLQINALQRAATIVHAEVGARGFRPGRRRGDVEGQAGGRRRRRRAQPADRLRRDRLHRALGRGAAFRLRHLLNNPELIARMGGGRPRARAAARSSITRHLTEHLALLIHLTAERAPPSHGVCRGCRSGGRRADTSVQADLAIGLPPTTAPRRSTACWAPPPSGWPAHFRGVSGRARRQPTRGSADGTRERAAVARVAGRSWPSTRPPAGERVAVPFHGVPGRGGACATTFEIAHRLGARALVLLEADTVSATPTWIARLAGPVAGRQGRPRRRRLRAAPLRGHHLAPAAEPAAARTLRPPPAAAASAVSRRCRRG